MIKEPHRETNSQFHQCRSNARMSNKDPVHSANL